MSSLLPIQSNDIIINYEKIPSSDITIPVLIQLSILQYL